MTLRQLEGLYVVACNALEDFSAAYGTPKEHQALNVVRNVGKEYARALAWYGITAWQADFNMCLGALGLGRLHDRDIEELQQAVYDLEAESFEHYGPDYGEVELEEWVDSTALDAFAYLLAQRCTNDAEARRTVLGADLGEELPSSVWFSTWKTVLSADGESTFAIDRDLDLGLAREMLVSVATNPPADGLIR